MVVVGVSTRERDEKTVSTVTIHQSNYRGFKCNDDSHNTYILLF